MKVLTTTGLSKLIELSKDTFVDKTDTTQVSLVTLADVATTGSYTDLSNKPTINSITLSGNKTSSDLGLQATLVSGTNIKTVNNNSLLGSGNITIDSLPAQSGQSGKYLTTDGTAASWATVDALPSQSGNNGKYLTTNGTTASWDALAAVANSGSYTDLSDKPTINDLTTTAQQNALNSGATSTNIAQITTNKNNISTINGKIPSAASSSNQLADKDFVNSSINAIAAYYITADATGNAFATKAALDTGPYYHDGTARTPTENDYAIVAADETHDDACTRYSYTGSQWSFQYVVNDTPFTQAQIDAINSGITSTMVGYLTNVTSDIQTQINGKQATVTGGASTITSSNLTASKALVSDSSGKVAASSVTSTELGYVSGVTSAIQTQINSKLNKLTYEWNNAISFGSTGKLCIGKFCCYDSNITIDIDATTSTTYHGTLVIALQNIGTSSGGSLVATVYGDATNTIAPNLYIYKHGANDCLVEVYFSPLAWSKNIIHIRAVSLSKDHGSVSYDSVAFDLCSSVSEIPAAATIKPTNALDSKQATLVSGTNIKTINNNSLLGSGNITIDSLPSQSGQSGKYLTTNGTSASWGNVPGVTVSYNSSTETLIIS